MNWWTRLMNWLDQPVDSSFVDDIRAMPTLTARSDRPRTAHDYGIRGWGHDLVFNPKPGTEGHEATATGWGRDIEPGDFLLLVGPERDPMKRSSYRVVSIRYYLDPPDMWNAELVFDPSGTRLWTPPTYRIDQAGGVSR